MTKVVVIEDDPIIRTDMAYILAEAGYTVFECNDGNTGINTALRELPEVMIADINLPDMSGVEVINRLRQEDSLKQASFVICSGSIPEEEIRSLVDGVLSKPFHPRQLIDLVKQLTMS
ncbi:MAG: response regulator [Pseudanabaenaceae cyanobacterium SKYGB_i_bin29]|nr:response regulator [Pseudanabaenaceae cyanobacterium SKYG29]MDW8421810.1 response regulator [Pseudanabaenaceae cyanobacterium SKYGB_i_bin29]